jgi:formylglycine-generating enzyme
MKRFNKTLALTLASLAIIAGNASAKITVDTVYVVDSGNANDTTGFGAVAADYAIGKYEVTLDQYCAFLNAVGKSDTYSLYNANMGTSAQVAGITRSGVSGSYTYAVTGSGSRPVTYVSWFDAARFVNWMHNSQPNGAQNASSTEQGAYTLNGATSGIGFTRNALPNGFAIPTENQWYKAAYYQPVANGGPVGGYWLYPTRSSTQPDSRPGNSTFQNSGNYYYNDFIANGYNGGYAVNNSTVLPTGGAAITAAGAYTLASSYYGTYDQLGNVAEWTDGINGSSRVVRGDSWQNGTGASNSRGSSNPTLESAFTGFRIAEIPEPGMVGCMALGLGMLVAWQRKQTR